MAAAPEELELSRSQELKETSSLEGKAQEPVTEKTSLLHAGSKNIQREEREPEDSESVYFKDGVRKIDFILTYKYRVVKKNKNSEEEIQKSSENRKKKRDKYFAKLRDAGFEFEEQDPKYYDGETTFVKVHATFETLAKGAEELLIRMPIREVDLPRKDKPFYRDMWRAMKIKDPFDFFDPKIPKKFKLKDCFTAPYNHKNHDKYLNSADKANFFSSAQRSAIVWYLLEKTQYGDQEDQVGVSRLLQNSSFTSAYPLHDGNHEAEDRNNLQNERQFLYYEWSRWTNFYKTQPLENIRHYFGEKIGLYFAWTGFYTAWLMGAAAIGLIVMICGFFTLSPDFNEVSREICNLNNREYFYMCPRCDETCNFWYYTTACRFSTVSLLFDYVGTVIFAGIMALWAVLFLEFWKRRQFQLQYEWDTLGYEAAEERERPEFVQAIKRKIKSYPPEKKKRYRIFNQVLERYEYIQPPTILWPKIAAGFSVLMTMVFAVLLMVFAVLIYRLAVSTLIYRLLNRLPAGPSIADLTVSITAAIIQLIFIQIFNFFYERIALWLTKWELHRTTTEFEDSFTFKMYLFQFVNYYSSIFYIAFIKGRFTGSPGDYLRIGSFRLDECATYGCLLELTIQLGIIFVGKQVLNDFTELGIPYAKTILKKVMRWWKERKKGPQEEDDAFVRWEKEFEMVPASIHGLFFEYLELVIQYGFVTIFVAAFPLAPLFAWINNVIEIRLDAHKFIQVLRRPVAQRAQDIGAWFYLLNFITKLCVITNAFLIAITSQFIDREMYRYVYDNNATKINLCSQDASLNGDPVLIDECVAQNRLGFVAWSTSPFNMTTLLEVTNPANHTTFFPFYSVQGVDLYMSGTDVTVDDLQYFPYINMSCLQENGFPDVKNFTMNSFEALARQPDFQELVLISQDFDIDQPIQYAGECFINATTCRFRGQVNRDNSFPLEYWRVLSVKLAFVIIFENLIFIISALLDWLVPDVPQSVEDEIRREKLLASRIDVVERASPTPAPEPPQEEGP